MEYRNLGRSGLKVSSVGLGCNNFGMKLDQAETDAVVCRAVDLGVTLFDTADVYGGQKGKSEELLGKALGARRSDIVLATKFGGAMGDPLPDTGGSRSYIMKAVEASLIRLGTDYIDLYQIHLPDPITPIDETLRALDDLIHQGKVRYIGNSNYAGWQVAEAAWLSRKHGVTPYISAQNRYSLLTRQIEVDLVPAAQYFGLGILPFFPLESGLLTGKYQRGADAPEGSRFDLWGNMSGRFLNNPNFDRVEKLSNLCEQYNHSLLELAIGWLAAKSYVTSVIAGATTPEQVELNVAAGDWRPSDEENASVDEISPLPAAPMFGQGSRI
jgi:aryl-alcohol dehydrogenase-like predicted oxidoreductase